MSNLQNIIAVVDDHPEIRASLEALLSAYGYDVETFEFSRDFSRVRLDMPRVLPDC